MTDEQIIAKLREIADLYNGKNGPEWTLYDLQCDIEEIFMALEARPA